jgi:GT2 family glycosyltransferase
LKVIDCIEFFLVSRACRKIVNMHQPTVVVVIVSYKSAQLTINSLKSLEVERHASHCTITAIVVDNASGDLPRIAEVSSANNWSSWLTLIAAPINGGFAYGNNLGIKLAYESGRPDYFHLLNPDTEVRPGAVDALVDLLERTPEAGIAGSGIENPDGSDWPIAFRFPDVLSEISAGIETLLLRRWEIAQTMTKRTQPVDWICGASMMIRPAVFEAVGCLDENYFLYFEETDFCLRAKKAGFSTWYVPESRVMHIVGQSTKVTDRKLPPRRLPAYWFESRRRYFSVHYGLSYAVLIDVVGVIAQSLGFIKRRAMGRAQMVTPHFIRDLINHSAIWPKNRTRPGLRGFSPKKA